MFLGNWSYILKEYFLFWSNQSWTTLFPPWTGSFHACTWLLSTKSCSVINVGSNPVSPYLLWSEIDSWILILSLLAENWEERREKSWSGENLNEWKRDHRYHIVWAKMLLRIRYLKLSSVPHYRGAPDPFRIYQGYNNSQHLVSIARHLSLLEKTFIKFTVVDVHGSDACIGLSFSRFYWRYHIKDR